MPQFDDEIGDAFADILDYAGVSVEYVRQLDRTTTQVRMVKSSPPAEFVTIDEQARNQSQIVDWKYLTAALEYAPQRGDKINYGGKVYEVLPTESEPVTRVTSPAVTRVHTKLVMA